MHPFELLVQNAPAIEMRLGYSFKDKHLLALAFVHCSFFNEHRGELPEHNERLEFLGDAVLGLLISDYLYVYLPHHPEGELSHLRSQLIESATCARFVTRLDIASYLLLGKGERRGGDRGRETILGDLFEAVIGAIYLDGGIEAAKHFFFHHFQSDVVGILQTPVRNWKAELQDYSQKKHQKPPRYQVIKETGPDHSKNFQIVVFINEEPMGEGVGFSKKEAEQAAAQDALNKLEGSHG